MTQNIVIYQDEGVGEFGVTCLRALFHDKSVRICDADNVIDGSAFDEAALFVMPGGADLPYCRKLNGTGNKNIRRYVEDGGFYLGLCAGAYYGCKALEFHAGRSDEISGPRELALLDAVAYGSLSGIAPYYDLTLKSAGLVQIAPYEGEAMRVLYHGGPAFRTGANVEILARYTALENQPPAIIAGAFGKGRVLLCGVHPEMNADLLPGFPVSTNEEEILREGLAARLRDAKVNTSDFLRKLIDRERSKL